MEVPQVVGWIREVRVLDKASVIQCIASGVSLEVYCALMFLELIHVNGFSDDPCILIFT